MKRASRLLSLGVSMCLVLAGCGGGPSGPSRPPASPGVVVPAPQKPPVPQATLAMAPSTVEFLPDGTLMIGYGNQVLLTRPEQPDVGELVPLGGVRHSAGNHVFRLSALSLDPSHPKPWRLALLDAQQHEVRSLEGEGPSSVAVSDDGELFAVGSRKVSIYRTSDFSLIFAGIVGPESYRPFGRLATTGDGKYAMVGSSVIDISAKKVVFTHVALGGAPSVLANGKLHWLFRDILQTVDLASGKAVDTWLPCIGRTAFDASSATFFSACEDALIRISVAESEPRIETLPLPPNMSGSIVQLDSVGRAFVSVHGPAAPNGMVSPLSPIILEKGKSSFVGEGIGVRPAPLQRPVLEPNGTSYGSCVVRKANGTLLASVHVDCKSTFSPDLHYVADSGRLVSLDKEQELLQPPLDQVAVSVEDGALVVSSGATLQPVRHYEIRKEAKAPVKETVRVEQPEGEHSTITLVDASGAKRASFEFDPFYSPNASLFGDGLVVYSGEVNDMMAVHFCTRAGKCEELMPEAHVMGFTSSAAFARHRGDRVFDYVRAGSSEVVSVAMPGRIRSAIGVADGFYVVTGDGPDRTLVHVSLAKRAIDMTTPLAGILGDLKGMLAGALVFSHGPMATLVDPHTLKAGESYWFGKNGHVAIEDGKYRLVGDAAPFERRVRCTDGKRFYPRSVCASTGGAPRNP